MLLLWKVNWIPTSQLGITKKKTKTPKPLICGLTSGSDSCGLANHARVSPELRCGCCQPRPPCAGPEPTQTPWTRSLPRCSCPPRAPRPPPQHTPTAGKLPKILHCSTGAVPTRLRNPTRPRSGIPFRHLFPANASNRHSVAMLATRQRE